MVVGYYRNGISLEALKVVRAMVESHCVLQSNLRRCVYLILVFTFYLCTHPNRETILVSVGSQK